MLGGKMNQVLEFGQEVHTEASKMTCQVERFLGGGGQGEVYQAALGGQPVALKWYFPSSATREQRAALEVLVEKGPPNDRFLWPMEVVSAPNVMGFGYIMPLREPRYKGIVDLMKRRIEPSFRALTTAGLDLSHSFLQLHSKGLCYRDISFGNVFFDPGTGDILICDNDNVTVDGEASGGVLGTPRFMAPEVVCGDGYPTTQTDLFSLAVLLFYIFMVHHPLEGRRELQVHCLDLPAMTQLYGSEPVFIFDPDDDTNRPVPGYHDNALAFWPIYPEFIRELFTKAFTVGVRDPEHGRVRESEWRIAMVRLRDSIIYCGHCGLENFYDVELIRAAVGTGGSCWACKNRLQLPPRIRIGKNIVMLNHDTEVFPHHVDDEKMYDFSQPVANVVQHPTNPTVWGLKNVSGEKWVVVSPDGAIRDVHPGRSVTMAAGININFGKSDGEIRV
jgi:DNA-binding helix-hairpin-helix protein with protein kinase domain